VKTLDMDCNKGGIEVTHLVTHLFSKGLKITEEGNIETKNDVVRWGWCGY
jgi:hypothetical protein